MTDRSSGEHGQSSLVVLAALALALVVVLGAVRLADVAVDRARAQAAADASALAGAARGPGAAALVGHENGARLVQAGGHGPNFAVVASVDGATASAQARWVPTPIP